MTTRAIERRREILTNAANLFREKGYPATGIRDIGDAVGINSASLYYHFKNKDEILLEAILYSIRVLDEAMVEIMSSETDLLAKIRAGIRTHLRLSLELQDFAAIILHEARHLSPQARLQVVAERDAYEALWAELLAEAKRQGIIKPHIDTHILRLVTFGAINRVVTWYNPCGEYTPGQIADALFDFIGHGILANGTTTD